MTSGGGPGGICEYAHVAMAISMVGVSRLVFIFFFGLWVQFEGIYRRGRRGSPPPSDRKTSSLNSSPMPVLRRMMSARD